MGQVGRPRKPGPANPITDPIGAAMAMPAAAVLPPPAPGDGADVHVVLEPLSQNLRHQYEAEVRDTLGEIERVQTASRDKHGKIKHAKFKAAVLVLRWEGKNVTEIKRILGCSRSRVVRALTEMREDADLTQQLDRVHQIVVPLAVDNLVQGVINGDKDYTLKTLEGTGIFRAHKTNEVVTKKTVFKFEVKCELPPGVTPDALPEAKAGSIVGAPSWAPRPLPAALPAVVVDEQSVEATK